MAYEFTRDAADWEAGQTFIRFAQAAFDTQMSTCMKTHGEIPPQEFPDTGPDNAQFPDLARIRRTGSFAEVTVPVEQSPTQGMTLRERAEYQNAEAECRIKADSVPTFTLEARVQPLANRWYRKLSTINASPLARADLRSFTRCVQRHGLGVATSVSAFLGDVDDVTARLSKASQEVERRNITKTYATAFAVCLAPEQEFIDRMALLARERFFGAWIGTVHRIRSTALRTFTTMLTH